jgi:hypothetical protein
MPAAEKPKKTISMVNKTKETKQKAPIQNNAAAKSKAAAKPKSPRKK